MPEKTEPKDERFAGEPFANALFRTEVLEGGIVSLKRASDVYDTDYILAGKRLGDVIVRSRTEGGDWRETGVDVRCDFAFEGDALLWTIRLRNEGAEPVELGDVAVPFPMNTDYVWDKDETAKRRVFGHSFVSGHGSFIFWARCNGVGPYLALVPQGDAKFEYYDGRGKGDVAGGAFMAYIHSVAHGAVAREKGCRWRQPHTSLILAPGEAKAYVFKLFWAQDYDAVRQGLYDEGKFDIHVVPGMTVPEDLCAMFSLRTRNAIASIEAEHPDQTEIECLGIRGADTHVYRVRFDRLGENLLTVRYGDGRALVLEFFVTEPVETLVRKRAAFLVNTQQHRDPALWYDGLISDWNMESQTLLSPDNLDRIIGWRKYMVSCDDPGLCKAPLVAAKNLEYPSPKEIEALDYYIERFVWGGLQRTDAEEHAYGIYGIPDWKELRESDDAGPKGRLHIWRIYDYPHVIMLYLKMYQIARSYPDVPMLLPPEEYLRRAFGTANAFFTIPLAVAEWSAYQTGTYNEVVIPELIDELVAHGWDEEAACLREHWETKVRFFINDSPNLFGSEYPFDSTGFESTHALAGYALERASGRLPGADALGVSLADAERFMDQQTACNITCRGWLDTTYYHLGSDFRGCGSSAYTLSYMSQMGGWSLLDHALHYAAEPVAVLRLAYASILSSWALMNTGRPETDYGYWYPGEANDGAAGGGFEPEPFGQTWLQQPHSRGAWYYGCEIDLGFGGALRAAATVVVEDPIFGQFAYGGVLSEGEGWVNVEPRDGVRRRFHVVRAGQRLHMELSRDHFAAGEPIRVSDDLSEIRFVVESARGGEHVTHLRVAGLPAGAWRVMQADEVVQELLVEEGGAVEALIGISGRVTLPLAVVRVGRSPYGVPPLGGT